MTDQTARLNAGSAQPRASRPQSSFERANAHSRRVRWLKLAIPVSATVLVLGFAGWAWLGSIGEFTADFTDTSIAEGRIVMSNPTLNGFTRDNLPYSMSAERASQSLSATGAILLEKIVARMPIDAGNWADIEAGSGQFDSENNSLDIDSIMKVTTTHGLVAEFQSAHLDMAEGTIVSEAPVRVEVNGSTLTAERLEIRERGKVIILEEQVRMTIAGGLDNWGNGNVE